MSPEMLGRPDRLSSLDDRGRSVGDGNTHTKPDVTVGDDKQPSTNKTDLDRVNDELAKHQPDSPAYNALKGRESKLLGEQPQTSDRISDADIRHEYGNPSNSSEIPASSEVNPVEESPESYRGPASGDDPFANLRSGYSDNPSPSETPESVASDSSEMTDGGGDSDI